MEENEYQRAELIGNQLTSLLDQTGINVTGLAIATDISVNHLRTIKNGKASISSKTAGKIADFFGVEIDVIFSAKLFKLKKWETIETIKNFYKENVNNPQFFVSRQGEESIAYFIKKELIPKMFFAEQREVNYVRKYIKKEYKRDFSSKEISRQLNRLTDSGVLSKEDKTGNKSIYLYKIKQLED
ncbi:helix-turn-helix transcriptional regulator [Pedobacter sp. UYP1]|uniref:helix-turn-helix transcriptional regulator n=1 Tax=Pedobacter sp. UYP1 TaxID=1756396 RepID=UPI00339AD4CD